MSSQMDSSGYIIMHNYRLETQKSYQQCKANRGMAKNGNFGGWPVIGFYGVVNIDIYVI